MTERGAKGEIILDGVRYPLSNQDGTVSFSDLARFQNKILFGDPSKDDNDLLSAWQMDNFSGGHGVLKLKEGTDQGRFHIGSIYGRYPEMITKPPYVHVNSGEEGTGNKQVLGEMWSADANKMIIIYEAGAGVIRRGIMSGSSGYELDAFYTDDVVGTMPFGSATGPGVSFQGLADKEWFFIPAGNDGYAYLTDTNDDVTINGSSVYRFQSFAVFDNKLIGITTGGRIYYTLDPDEDDDGLGAITWTPYDLTYSLSRSYRVRKIINYFDRGDRPCLFILTNRDMWQFDPDGPEIFRIDYGWPGTKYSGQAACVWRGQLFIATGGMGVMRYTGGTWMPIGLNRDNGLPAEYQGHVVDLVAGQDSMYALVQGSVTDPVYGSKSSIHEFSGSGWQMIWCDDTAVPSSIQYRSTLATTATTVTGMIVTGSTNDEAYTRQTLVFSTAGTDDHIYTMMLPTTDSNPRAGIGAGQLFGSGDYYFLETGEFNADMMGYTKIGNAIQFLLEEPIPILAGERDTFKVLYRLDRGSWVEAASITAVAGKYAYTLGDTISGTDFKQGVNYEVIQFRFEIRRGTPTNLDKPMVLSNFVHSFLKIVASNFAFTVGIDVSKSYGGLSPRQLAERIDDLTTIKRWALLTVGVDSDGHPRNYRVFVSQNKGADGTGDTQMGNRQLSIVEVPSGLSP